MSTDMIELPAISRELDFIARHWKEAGDIYEEKLKVDDQIKTLTVALYDKATNESGNLLANAASIISQSAKEFARFKWSKFRKNDWELRSYIFQPRGGKTALATTGFNVHCTTAQAPALVGWLTPRGNLDERRSFINLCSVKTVLVSDNDEQYPGWSDTVVWFRIELDEDTTWKSVADSLAAEAACFFKAALPLVR
jgi:hypothetical protein